MSEGPAGVNPEVVELASEDDRLWFEDHPRERFRYRDAFSGEMPSWAWDAPDPPPGHHWERQIFVELVAPGLRFRRPWVVAMKDDDAL